MKLGHVQSPQEIAGGVELDPFDELSEYFSSPPSKHVHIIVQLPPLREYFRHPFMLPVSPNDPSSSLRYPPYIFHAVPFLAPLYVLSSMFAHLAVLAALPIVDGPLYIPNFLPQLPRDILRVSEFIYNACLSCNHLLVASTFHPTKPTSQLIVSHPVHVPRVFTLSF